MRFNLPFHIGQLYVVYARGQAVRFFSPIQTNLVVRKYTQGKLIEERNLGAGLVTTAGVNLMAADWTNGTATIKLMKYHDTGTGTLTPSVSDTVIQIPTGAARGVGSQSSSANIYQTIANVTFGSSFLVTEWGLFSAASGGTLWDRRTWSGTNVANGDVLQFVYQLSILAGG